MRKVYKALSLVSEGLDSMLAAKLMLDQGVHVEGVNFFTGFCGDHNYCLKNENCGSHGAKWVCDQLGIKLHVINIFEEYKDLLSNPKHGYGANLNPCLDCKLFMIQRAKDMVIDFGYDFLITGEVLGQRPKSQRKDTLPIASKLTGGIIVRPLSAKLLEPTVPEIEGWINRDLMYGIEGRSRKPQIELAKKQGFKKFPQPAGGCLLTDEKFCNRLKDLWDSKDNTGYSLDDAILLRVGRHFRINESLKVIVGRNEVENNFLKKFSKDALMLQADSHPGSTLLVYGKLIEGNFDLVARLAAYFGKGRDAGLVAISVVYPNKKREVIEVTPLKNSDILDDWYI